LISGLIWGSEIAHYFFMERSSSSTKNITQNNYTMLYQSYFSFIIVEIARNRLYMAVFLHLALG
jgi:hypothetical protein